MQETRERIVLDTAAVERGYKSCKVAVTGFFKPWRYVISNLPGDKRRGMHAVLAHVVRAIDMLDLESHNGLPLDVWCEIRDDLSDALCGQCTTIELAALADARQEHEIPRQFLFEILEGADLWIRTRKFETFDELEVFAARLGGGSMAACASVLGIERPDYEVAAVQCGKAIMLTHLLAGMVTNTKQNKLFLPQQDLTECEIEEHRVKLRQTSGKSLNHFVRLMCSRIEKLFYEGGQLVNHMDFDGVRTVKSLLELHWTMLMKMKREPEVILSTDGVLSGRELLLLKSKHFMGLEGKVPIVPEGAGHHDHH